MSWDKIRGTYALLIEIRGKRNIQVGRLGKFTFPPGFYTYVGSAKNNLEKRVKRHLSSQKKLFWHIDYILQTSGTNVKKVWAKQMQEECLLAKNMAASKLFRAPVPGFGSSDCRCKTHFFAVTQPGKEGQFFRKNEFFALTLQDNMIHFATSARRMPTNTTNKRREPSPKQAK